MNVLVFGKSGQVAKELSRFGSDQAFSMNFIDRKIADLLYPDNCEKIILSKKPDAVINAAAWTSVDEAETFENEANDQMNKIITFCYITIMFFAEI